MSNGIQLDKGQKINLSKTVASLTNIKAVIGWNANTTDTGVDFDVDVSAFICKHNASNLPKLISNEWFIFYNNLKSPDGAVVHRGDNLTGATDDSSGECEAITVDIKNINEQVDEISFVVTIHDAAIRRQNFGQIINAYICLFNEVDGHVIANYDLSDDFSIETAVQVGSLYKKNGDWMFHAVGAGYKTGLASFVQEYGGTLA